MKRLLLLLAALLLFTHLAWGQEAPAEDNTPTLWEKIRTKIEQITPTQKPSVTTAVGGVRGEKMANDEVYWRGEEGEIELSTEEMDAFSSGLQHAEKQEQDAAIAAFQDFLKRFPNSALADDARQALHHLKSRPTTK